MSEVAKRRFKEERDNMKTLMRCGHVVNATLYGKSYCIRCNCFDTEDMSRRKAECRFCGKTTQSDVNLPFFKVGKNGVDEYCCEDCF